MRTQRLDQACRQHGHAITRAFGNTPEIGRCPRCGALLRFSSLRAYGTGPPTLLH